MKYFSEDEVKKMLSETDLADFAYATPEEYISNMKGIEIPNEHGRLIDADQLQEVLNLTLSLVITDQLTDKEIELVHRTIGAISDAVNDMDTVLEANK